MAVFQLDALTFNTTAGNKVAGITGVQVGEIIVAICANTGTTTDPTVTDDRGGTYTRIGGATKNGSADEVHIFVRDRPCQVAATHTLSMDIGGTGTGGGIWDARISGMQKYGANAIRQIATQDNQAGGGQPTVTFNYPILPENLCIFAVFSGSNPPNLTPPSGFTDEADNGYNTPASGIEIAVRDSGQSGTTIVSGSASSASAFCTIAVELDCATPTSYGSGRFERPGRPHEMVLRRLPFPAYSIEDAPVVEIPTPGGATAGGVSPLALVPGSTGGGVGGGTTPGPAAGVAPGGALVQGVAALTAATAAQGGAVAQGNTPTAVVPSGTGGATVSGNDVTVLIPVDPGGLVTGGNAPIVPLFDTPTPGGATAQGNAPTPIAAVSAAGSTGGGNPPGGATSSAAGGATVQGNTPTPSATPTPGGLVTGGNTATAVIAVTPGGLVTGGNAPTAPQTDTPTPGGATVGGNTPSPYTPVTAVGATGGGNPPSTNMTSAAGGATVQGNTPTPTVVLTAVGATVNGTTATVLIPVTPGGVIVGGRAPGEPTLVAYTGFFDRPTPGGKTNPGSPSAGMYDRSGPRQSTS